MGPIVIDADAEVTTTILEAGGSYRIMDVAGQKYGGVEAIAGARYTKLEGDLALNTAVPALGLSAGRTFNDERDWIDPFVGMQFLAPLSEDWVIHMRGDVGGFGVGSDLSWNAQALFGYRFQMFEKNATFSFGYRGLYMDYEDGSGTSRFAYDMTMHRPVVGLTIEF